MRTFPATNSSPKRSPLMSISFLLCDEQPQQQRPPCSPPDSLSRSSPCKSVYSDVHHHARPSPEPLPVHHHHHHHSSLQAPTPQVQQPQASSSFANNHAQQHNVQVEQGEPKLNGPPLANGAMLVLENNQLVLVLVCRLCGARFPNEASLHEHKHHSHKGEINNQVVLGVKPSAASSSGGNCQWPGCTKHFKRSDQLMLHVRTHTNERPHKCTTCGRGFAQAGDLVRHERTHSGEAPYPCRLCPKRFRTSNALRRHLMVHSGVKPHRCTWAGCSAAFTQKYDLKTHIRTHTGEKPYHCPFPGCDKRFSDASGLRSHRKCKHS